MITEFIQNMAYEFKDGWRFGCVLIALILGLFAPLTILTVTAVWLAYVFGVIY